MTTVLTNIKDEFKKLCVMVPKDENLDMDDPSVPVKMKKKFLLRAPWQDPVEHEDRILSVSGDQEPPRWIIDRYKAVMSQWFFKDTLATSYKQ